LYERTRLNTDTRLGFSRRHATSKGESIMYPRAFCLAALVTTTLTITSADAQAVGAELTVFGGRGVARPFRWGLGGEVTLLIGSHLTLAPRYFQTWGDFTRSLGDNNFRVEDNNATVWGGDVGVRFLPADVEIRPVVYFGWANFKQVITVGPGDGSGLVAETTALEPVIAPGVIITLPLRYFRIGGELRYVAGPHPDGFSTDFDPQSFVFYFRLTYAIVR
jgi:hypothetical protein